MSEINYNWTDAPICPYCGHEHTDWWEFVEDDADGELNCYSCDREFGYEVTVIRTFSTEKKEVADE